jgi:hypothetical protein
MARGPGSRRATQTAPLTFEAKGVGCELGLGRGCQVELGLSATEDEKF